MTEPTKKKISRRDAVKLLGVAVGAAALSGLPSKWNKPALAASELPAHAQTSVVAYAIDCGGNGNIPAVAAFTFFPTAGITSRMAGVVIDYTVTLTGLLVSASPLSGSMTTGGNGIAQGAGINLSKGIPGNTITVTYRSANGAPCTSVFTLTGA